MNIESILNLSVKTEGLLEFLQSSSLELEGEVAKMQNLKAKKEKLEKKSFKILLSTIDETLEFPNDETMDEKFCSKLHYSLSHLFSQLESNLPLMRKYEISKQIFKMVREKLKHLNSRIIVEARKILSANLPKREFPILQYSSNLDKLEESCIIALKCSLIMKILQFFDLVEEDLENNNPLDEFIKLPIENFITKHFIENKSSTNRIDKPEWFFNHLFHIFKANSEVLGDFSFLEGKEVKDFSGKDNMENLLRMESGLDPVNLYPSSISQYLILTFAALIKGKFKLELEILNSEKSLLFSFVNQTFHFLNNCQCQFPMFEFLFSYQQLQPLLSFEKDSIMKVANKRDFEIQSLSLLFNHFFAKYSIIRGENFKSKVSSFYFYEIFVPVSRLILRDNKVPVVIFLFEETRGIWGKQFQEKFRSFLNEVTSDKMNSEVSKFRKILKGLLKSQEFLDSFTLDIFSVDIFSLENFRNSVDDIPILISQFSQPISEFIEQIYGEFSEQPILLEILVDKIENEVRKHIFEDIFANYKFSQLGLENICNFFLFVLRHKLFQGSALMGKIRNFKELVLTTDRNSQMKKKDFEDLSSIIKSLKFVS